MNSESIVYLYGSARDASTRAQRRIERIDQGRRDNSTLRVGPNGGWLIRPNRRVSVRLVDLLRYRDTLVGPLSRGYLQVQNESGRVLDWKQLFETPLPAPTDTGTTAPAAVDAEVGEAEADEKTADPVEETIEETAEETVVETVGGDETRSDELQSRIATYLAMPVEALEAAYLELLQAEEDGAVIPPELRTAIENRINGKGPVDYGSWSAADLRAELTKRGLSVADSRKRDQLIAALTADDTTRLVEV